MRIPHTPEADGDVLAKAVRFLREEVAPRAEAIDIDTEALGDTLRAMGDVGLLGLRVPNEFGGEGIEEISFRRFQEECARASGCLAFLQTQHQSAGAMLAKSENLELKQRFLPVMASGARLSGIAFSQLRRHGDKPLLIASECDGGFVIKGKAPWVTGLGFFQSCVTAAMTESGETLFFIHPFSSGTEGLVFSEPMRLAAMEPAQTVSATFEDFFVGNQDVLYLRPGNWIENNDMLNIALQTPFALGCAQAALDVLEANFARKGIAGIADALRSLSDELTFCKAAAYQAMDNQANVAASLSARGRAVELMLRCAAAALVSSSGAGNSLSHPAQRVYREALVFAVSAQTSEIMEATLERLSRISA